MGLISTTGFFSGSCVKPLTLFIISNMNVGVERELSRLFVEVVHVDLRHLAVISSVDVVPAQQEVDVVGQRVVAAAEESLRVVADAEITRDLELVDLLYTPAARR